MPSSNPNPIQVPQLRGADAWGRYLDRLSKAVRASGVAIPDTRSALADYALAVLGTRYGMKAPPRCKPVGSNQHWGGSG